MFQKGEELILNIDDLGKDGEGIGRVDGYTLFVKEALPGESVRVQVMKCKKNYGFARLLEVIKASPDRVIPVCQSARACGGCTLQHLSYAGQLAYKEKKVKDCLTRIGGINLASVECLPILGMEDEPWHYRNKAQFPVRYDRKMKKPVVGFYAGRTHSIVPVTDCAIQSKSMKEILELLLEQMQKLHISAYDEESANGMVRHIFIRKGFATGEIMVCLVVNAKAAEFCKAYGASLGEAFSSVKGVVSVMVNENRRQTNVILGEKMQTLWGKDDIEDIIGNVHFRISAQSFYQVNPAQTLRLYETALAFASLKPGETVWDLYCGIGTISLFLAEGVGNKGHVIGVEIIPAAVENARENARLNGLKNVEFHCGAAEDVVSRITDEKTDVVVVDPPRKGCDRELLTTIRKMSPSRIVYVSCDPATLARDVKILAGEEGDGLLPRYVVTKVQPCDMFPGSGHVETIVALHRTNS